MRSFSASLMNAEFQVFRLSIAPEEVMEKPFLLVSLRPPRIHFSPPLCCPGLHWIKLSFLSQLFLYFWWKLLSLMNTKEKPVSHPLLWNLCGKLTWFIAHRIFVIEFGGREVICGEVLTLSGWLGAWLDGVTVLLSQGRIRFVVIPC